MRLACCYSNGSRIVGTIASKAAATYTPGTSNQVISSGVYLSGNQTIKGDSNLIAGNIKSGVSIFGVSGSLASASNVFSDTYTLSNSKQLDATGDGLAPVLSAQTQTLTATANIKAVAISIYSGYDSTDSYTTHIFFNLAKIAFSAYASRKSTSILLSSTSSFIPQDIWNSKENDANGSVYDYIANFSFGSSAGIYGKKIRQYTIKIFNQQTYLRKLYKYDFN